MKIFNSFTNRETILWMLKEDDCIRLQAETQTKFKSFPNFNEQLQLIDDIQKSIVSRAKTKFHIVKEDDDFGLSVLRSVAQMYKGDEEIRNSCHYLKHNRVLNNFEQTLSIGSKIEKNDFDIIFLNEPFDFNTQNQFILMSGSVS